MRRQWHGEKTGAWTQSQQLVRPGFRTVGIPSHHQKPASSWDSHSEGIKPAETLLSDSWNQELWENMFVLSMWSFAMEVLGTWLHLMFFCFNKHGERPHTLNSYSLIGLSASTPSIVGTGKRAEKWDSFLQTSSLPTGILTEEAGICGSGNLSFSKLVFWMMTMQSLISLW